MHRIFATVVTFENFWPESISWTEVLENPSDGERNNSRAGLIRKRFYSFSLVLPYISIRVRVVDDGRPQFDKGRGKKGKGKRENERRYEWNEGTYSRRVVVIGGNFIILRHYPRYCNAIKLDTLRTPCGTGVYLCLLPLSLPLPFASLTKTPERDSPCCGLLHLILTTLLGIYRVSGNYRTTSRS